MKWLIVEDALRDRKGHWMEYVSTFVRELRVLGDEVVVLCDRKAQGFVMEQTGARPVLPESIWHRMGDGAGALKRYLRLPGHAIATFFALRKVFREFNHRGHREHRVGGKSEIKCETGRMDEAQCNAQEICAGAFESDSLTSKLAESPVSESPIRRANGPASSPATSHSPPVTAPQVSSASLPATSHSLLATPAPPDVVFLAFGQIRDGKNLDLFLRAMIHLTNNVKLLVAGKGDSGSSRPAEYYQKLAQELGVAERCRWDIRRIPEDEVGDIFAASDVVLVTYSAKFRSASGVLNAAISLRGQALILDIQGI